MDDFADLKRRALDLYKPPFRYDSRGGYIFDADNRMVADQRENDPPGTALRVRGWGRIGYLKDPEKLQDAAGELMAEALTVFWEKERR